MIRLTVPTGPSAGAPPVRDRDPDQVVRVAEHPLRLHHLAEAYEHFLINTFADLPGLARMTSQFTMKTIKPGGRLPL